MTKKIIIMDGGMGCELQAMGAPFRKPEWSALPLMKAPETVMQAHHAFIDAGAEIIISNAYAIVPFHIGQERFDEQALDLAALSANIARQAADSADHSVQVAGCLPPVFGSYRPDLFDAEKAPALYAPLIEGQKDDIDFWLAETMSSIAEVKTVAKLVERTNKPLWVAYTISDTQDNGVSKLRSRETIEEAVQAALDINARALLFNCSKPEVIESALDIVQKMNISIPYGVYANTFPDRTRDYLANDAQNQVEMREDITIGAYYRYAEKWVSQGAMIIGGCCGIGPKHIQRLTNLNE